MSDLIIVLIGSGLVAVVMWLHMEWRYRRAMKVGEDYAKIRARHLEERRRRIEERKSS